MTYIPRSTATIPTSTAGIWNPLIQSIAPIEYPNITANVAVHCHDHPLEVSAELVLIPGYFYIII